MTNEIENFKAAREQHFVEVRKIIQKHFPNFAPSRIDGITGRFIAEREVGLYESWDYPKQQKHLSGLRLQLAKAAKHLAELHPHVRSELSLNVPLPLEVLNQKVVRRDYPEEAFLPARSVKHIDRAQHVFEDLLNFAENIDKAISYAQHELVEGIPVKNRNIDEWRVVEAAIDLIRSSGSNMNIPKRMNGSGPLWRFLSDLFQHYEKTGNVNAAFSGWLKNIDKKRETLQLLAIE